MPPLIFAILALLYISALGLLAQQLRPLARKLLIALTAIEIIIAVVYLAGWTNAFPFWDWFLDPLGGEQNAPATFSATQLVTTGLIAALNIFATSRWQQRYWLLLTLAFLFMGLDEYYMFHEPIYNWEYGYAGLGISIVLSTIVMFWVMVTRINSKTAHRPGCAANLGHLAKLWTDSHRLGTPLARIQQAKSHYN